MRKLFLSAAFAASLTISYAQDLKDVQEKISKGKYDEAKEKLDKFMADPKNANNATAYYWKGKINTYYAQTDTAGTLTYDAAGEAFTAYKKTLELEPKNVSMTLDQNIGLICITTGVLNSIIIRIMMRLLVPYKRQSTCRTI